MADTFYNVLGIKDTSTKEEIKKAYRSLQMKYHPDRNPGNTDTINMTQKINEAYEVLGDEQKKQEYDMSLKNPFMRMQSNGGGGREVPIDEIFQMFFGMGGQGMAGHGMSRQGHNINIFHGPHGMRGGGFKPFEKPVPIIKTISINMEQSFSGAVVPLEIEKWVMEDGDKVFSVESLKIQVPPGADDNEIIIIRNAGNELNGELKGDIKIFIKVQNDTPFKRVGLDILLEKKITLKESLCGFSFDLIHLSGKSFTLNNNKGNIIHPEYKKIYQGMGFTKGSKVGNMILLFHVEFPEKLSEEQIKQIETVL